MMLELGQGFVDQPGMARRVFAHELLAAARGAGVPSPGR
jgi:hypothetical protein